MIRSSHDAEKERAGDQPLPVAGTFLRLLLALFPLAVLAWYLLGRRVVEKVLVDLVLPVGSISCLLLLISITFLRMRRFRESGLVAIVLLITIVSGNRYVANHAIGSLEGRYSSIDPLKMEVLDVLVLLGGATRETPSGGFEVNYNGDRIVTSARMFHHGRVKRIYCTGTRTVEVSKATTDEAEQAQSILIDLGVPAEAIVRLKGRNTFEEMESIAEEFGDRRVGILTSAWHLPRAMRLAESAGVHPVPVPSNFIGRGVVSNTPVGAIIRDCVPHHDALMINARAMKEYLATIVRR